MFTKILKVLLGSVAILILSTGCATITPVEDTDPPTFEELMEEEKRLDMENRDLRDQGYVTRAELEEMLNMGAIYNPTDPGGFNLGDLGDITITSASSSDLLPGLFI